MTNNNEQQNTKKFEGFPLTPESNYWPYPRIMDGWWHILTGSEQKCLDYILRHTWGFKKAADAISLSQFTEGVKNLDKGVGLSKGTVIVALKALKQKGFIQADGFYRSTNRYKLVQDPNIASIKSKRKESAKSKLPGSGETGHTITDIPIKDITIKDTQTSITLQRDVIPSYISLIANVYALTINKNTDADSSNVRGAVHEALREHGPLNLLRAIGNKYGDERWLDFNERRSIIWFMQSKLLPSWVEENKSLRLRLSPYQYMRPEERKNHPFVKLLKEIAGKEGRENLEYIFKGYEETILKDL